MRQHSSLKLLREYVKYALSEAAVSAQQAAAKGLALSAANNAMVLYNPKHYEEFLQDNRVSDVSGNSDGIVGFIKLAPGDASSCWGAAEVAASAAEKGWGPLMYDIAMSMSSAPLMADRSNLSSKAANIWKYYDEKRSDVKKLPLDNIDDPKTPDTKDDCAVYDCSAYGGSKEDVDSGWDDEAPSQCAVNKAYTGVKVDASSLVNNHKKFVESLGKDAASFQKALVAAAQQFFDEKYNG